MQHLCVLTAVQVNPDDPDWQVTAGGHVYNHKYGFGNLNAQRIVDAAREFPLVKPQAWFETLIVPVDQPITKGDDGGASSRIIIGRDELGSANFERLEHVTVTVEIEHQRRGNVEVTLESPNGVRSVLARPRRYDEATTGFPQWTFMSVKHWCAHFFFGLL
jgi:kexin